jgi:parvulin-like peptidyl-prolyl isomerase
MIKKTPSTAKPDSVWDPTEPRLVRSILLSGLAALVGLGLAGFALFTAKGTSTLIVPPEDVALVNQQPVSRSDYLQLMQNTLGLKPADATPEQRKKILDDMIREELFVQRGKELDVASTDPDVRVAMVSAVEQSIAADVMSSQPSDEKLMAFYEQHKDDFSSVGIITLRDLLFRDAGSAAAAAQQLRGGANPDQVLAALHGQDTKKTSGEEFYFAAKIHLGDALFKAAVALPSKSASDPIPMADGVHVLAVQNNTPPVALSFPQARQQVLDAYKKSAITRVQQADEGYFRKRANVLIAKDMR